ncbi:hypothetical protein ACMGD3_16545 [Lysinibacillus sphaericus]|uniref:hypothetical protein n=1 Tax=Lysinibacillus sphaericus TaxID=1421 RepID=UPI003F79C116
MAMKKNIVFGTGRGSKLLLGFLDLDVAYFVDNDQSKWGQKYLDRNIHNPKELLNEKNKDICIWISSMYYDEILIQLNHYGFVENKDYINGLEVVNAFIKEKEDELIRNINISMTKGILSSSLREIKAENPTTWEFSAFSQNGEDGIIDYLTKNLLNSNRFFVEIGSSDGIENNTAFLSIVKKYSGLMIEGNDKLAVLSSIIHSRYNLGVECFSEFITVDTINLLITHCHYSDPDIMTIDIDGNDYYIVEKIFHLGYRPKIFVVEYNSSFGPSKSITIEYDDDFDYSKAHESLLYYGVSITAWKKLFEKFGYHFVTVEQNGVNAIFVNSQNFTDDFLGLVKGIEFKENFYQMKKFKMNWEKQFKLIEEMKFIEV